MSRLTGSTVTERFTGWAASSIGARTSRRGFFARTAIVGSALTVAGPSYVLRPGTAYAQVTAKVTCRDCGGTGLCCDGYTEFCCHLDESGANQCPPGTLLAGWWKVDNSDFCFGTARYYMDCNKEAPGCACGSSGVCQDDPANCGCRACDNRKDGCTVFRYGNCHNDLACVGPIMCRVVTCTKPWEIEPTCSEVPRTDEQTRNHHRPCLERDPTHRELAFVKALFVDFLGRESDADGESYWGTQMVRAAHLAQGGRDRIAASFGFSDEYLGFVVAERYRSAFDRDPEPDGQAYWTQRLRDGVTPQELAVIFYGSQEFFDASGQDLDTFIQRLYQKALGRDVVESELEYWLGLLAQGWTREEVARSVYASEESRRRRVEALYQLLLGRAAEEAGRDYWVEVLAESEDLSLAVFLAASDEYSDRAEVRYPETGPEPEPEPIIPELLQ